MVVDEYKRPGRGLFFQDEFIEIAKKHGIYYNRASAPFNKVEWWAECVVTTPQPARCAIPAVESGSMYTCPLTR
ncbi:MAG: hypothetical protein ABR903_05235 [Thermodesulfovibrionales bacterium]|jgi:hypothetical protein